MLTPDERDLLTDIQDRLLELYVMREWASKAGQWERVEWLAAEIAQVEAKRARIRRLDTVGSA